MAEANERAIVQEDPAARGILAEILDALRRHRGWVLTLYLLLLLGWFALVIPLGIAVSSEVFHELIGTGGIWTLDDFGPWGRVAILAAFLALQAAFIWGGGRIRMDMERAKPWKLAVSVLIFSLFMAVLSTGFILSFLEMTDRLGTVGTVRLTHDRMNDNALLRFFGVLVLWSWIPWLAVGWLCVWKTDHYAGLRRLALTLLAGSWIEFAVALPVDLTLRTRTKECPCAAGSWLALVLCLPILIWSVGPAIYFLYRNERRLSAGRKGHARRILAAKSSRLKKFLKERK